MVQPLDRLVLEVAGDGVVSAVGWPALGVTFSRLG